ncbi:hypothetical protein BDN72DRAFT_858717 [Pluteus cervinus]|uniref:Uncharacterized protein n=1 Tax=Pluteus cervinus TaxID=181527 RepID=A0ACD3AQX4_9AGAR|nr:hypothetical protein BDN72DRAFT_858717 [Pluteus cervinus]
MSIIFQHVPTSRRDLITVQELGEVCPIWKDISQETPALWTFFYLSFPLNEKYPELRLIQAYHWLLRSKALPCELEIDTTLSLIPSRLYKSHFRPLLASVSRRLTWFWFCGHVEDFEDLFQNLPHSFPELRSLSLVPRRFGSPLNIYPRAFRDSKFLKELTVSGRLFESTEVVKEVLSVKRLTALVLEGHGLLPGLAYTLFCTATNLVRCTISVKHFGGEEILAPAPISNISHRHLQELTLGYLSTDFAWLIRHFKFPALTKLNMKGDPKIERTLINSSVSGVLLELHRRDPFPLEVLELKDVNLDVQEFVTFLKRVPMLAELRVLGVNDSFYLQNRIRGLSSGALPILSELKVATIC